MTSDEYFKYGESLKYSGFGLIQNMQSWAWLIFTRVANKEIKLKCIYHSHHCCCCWPVCGMTGNWGHYSLLISLDLPGTSSCLFWKYKLYGCSSYSKPTILLLLKVLSNKSILLSVQYVVSRAILKIAGTKAQEIP